MTNFNKMNSIIFKFVYYGSKVINYGNSIIMESLGRFYNNIKYYEKAKYHYTKASELGNINAIVKLAFIFLNDKDYKNAEKWYIKASELGNPLAMNNLATIYHNVYKDHKKAEELYTKASDLGEIYAMNNLGVIYYNVYKDYKKAEEWYIKASDLGDLNAMNNLALFYAQNNNYEKTEELFIKSSKSNDAQVIYNIGHFYQYIKNDVKNAEKWYTKAYKLGLSESIFALGLLYKNHKNYKKAYEFFMKIDKSLEIFKTFPISEYIEECIINMKKLTKIYCDFYKDQCNVCYDDLMNTDDGLNVLKCGHVYHSMCVKGLINCPYCRIPIIS